MLYIEGLELKRTMSTLVGFEIIEFQTLQASEKCTYVMLCYVLIYYSRIQVKNLIFGLKNIHCVLLLCITDVYYYYAFLCAVYYY